MANAAPVTDNRTSRINAQDDVAQPLWSEPIPSPQDGVFNVASPKKKKLSKWRHTLGVLLLLLTVFLWTASNFLASTIFADDSYSKPYFVTYINTSFFIFLLIPALLQQARKDPSQFSKLASRLRGARYSRVEGQEIEGAALLRVEDGDESLHQTPSGRIALQDGNNNAHIVPDAQKISPSKPFDLGETVRLGLEFSILWYLANYFIAACLEYTTVASSTILTSTSSVWTLLFGALMRVERFSISKLIGVLASLTGIIMISTMDLSGENDDRRGSFPHKTRQQIAIGDALAFLSALIYGIYSVFLKKRVGDETRINMPLFFGFVGLWNVLLLWPGMIILHFTGVERFELPPDNRILKIVLINSTSSMISDYCWAYSMLLTSPLVVTVGLSMTIPLSLIGQMILNSQTSSLIYWFGAAVVLSSFIFINHESAEEEKQAIATADGTSASAHIENT